MTYWYVHGTCGSYLEPLFRNLVLKTRSQVHANKQQVLANKYQVPSLATEYISQYLSCTKYLQHLYIFTYVLINNVVHLYLLLSYHYFTSLYFILSIFILLSLITYELKILSYLLITYLLNTYLFYT